MFAAHHCKLLISAVSAKPVGCCQTATPSWGAQLARHTLLKEWAKLNLLLNTDVCKELATATRGSH